MVDKGYLKMIDNWLIDRSQAWVSNSNLGVAQKERGVNPIKRESYVLHLTEQHHFPQVYVSLRLQTRNTYRIKGEVIAEVVEESISLMFEYTQTGWKMINQCHNNSYRPLSASHIVLYPDEESQVHNGSYNREKAVEYAEKYWNTPNSRYVYIKENNCTNYISQCLVAGGLPMQFSRSRGKGWWYKGPRENWSFSWAVASSLGRYLQASKRVERRSQAKGLQLGDVICYDWEGNGRWNHNTIVTKIDPNGMPLVNANTVDSQHRYWEYTDSYAYEKGKTKYAFYHILN